LSSFVQWISIRAVLQRVAERPQLPRPSSTLPKLQVESKTNEGGAGVNSDVGAS